MTPNSNISPLAWYRDISLQMHRKSYAFGYVYPLFALAKRIPPFQIIREHLATINVSVKLYTFEDALIGDITSEMVATGLSTQLAADYDNIIYSSILPVTFDMPDGRYYMTLTDSVSGIVWYSEVFNIAQDCSKLLKLSWWDSENLELDNGRIIYEGIPYKNWVYLDAELGKPEYTFKEEGQDRDGFFFREKQVSTKTHKFTFPAPEYLLDALRLAVLSDYVLVESLGSVSDCDTFLITPKWNNAVLASTEAEFTTNTAVKKIGRGRIPGEIGDYNNDYNNDYYNTES